MEEEERDSSWLALLSLSLSLLILDLMLREEDKEVSVVRVKRTLEREVSGQRQAGEREEGVEVEGGGVCWLREKERH